jgi:putative membrane protein insertion efficiency factor
MQFLADILALIFDFWHKAISPALPGACRHEPTCSQYGAQSLREFGLFKGSWLALHRILRCQPWGTSGYDPVPSKKTI